MVIAHGSAGVETREGAWADRLNALGLATFVVDSFTPRGVRETASDQTRVPTAANVADALAALRLLATHPRIDPERIGVIGFSKGGQVALYTALEPFRRAVVDDDRHFAAHVALYPYCNDWYQAERIDGAPMLCSWAAATTTRRPSRAAATRSGSAPRGRTPR
jgi:dienelactone hydrolase